MKKRYIFILVVLIAGISLVSWKWNTWFKNKAETVYSTPNKQDRIILSLGEDALTTRRISWRCDSILSTSAFIEVTKHPEKTRDSINSIIQPIDTQRIIARGTIVASRAGKSTFYNTEITHLNPGSTYSYRIVNDNQYSEWYTFSIPPIDSAMSFLYLGDVQDPEEGKTGELFQELRKTYPEVDFWAFAGDIIERPMDIYWNHWFTSMDSITPVVPIIAATGNHEYLKGLPKILDPRWIYSFYNPENGPKDFKGRSYFVNFKDLCYIVLDTDGIQGPESLYNHYAWLKNVLAVSDKKWKIVMMHHPVYSIREGRNNYYVRWTFKSLFEKYGVNLVLQGHDHGYSRITTHAEEKRHTPVYIVSSCSPKTYSIGFDERHDRLGANLKLYQYITLKNDTLQFKAFTFNHELYDDLSILQNGEVIDHAKQIPEQLNYPFGNSKKDREKAEIYQKKVNDRMKKNTSKKSITQ